MTSAAIVSKLWNYCNVLRDDGMSYGDYVEQLTYLLFLKMADERTKPPYNQPSAVPAKYNWPTLLKKDGDDLFDHYRHMLESGAINAYIAACIRLYLTSLAVTIRDDILCNLYGNRMVTV
jgi:hypothetical protein